MFTKIRQAARKQQRAAPGILLSPLLGGKAKLTVNVHEIDFGWRLGVRQHVLGTWRIGNETVFSLQGWKPPKTNRMESLEAVDGVTEDKAEVIAAIGNWGEETLDDFSIENVFQGGRLIRHSAGYESSTIYLERITGKDRKFERSLYGV